jgi:hypothetical protein|tara:strand:- start:487 stop:669 length:183 start_codon:yes stop_codon:yes gene_type:complete
MTLEELTANVGNHFIKERHGQRTEVVLEEVRKNKVLLRIPDRKDGFRETVADFTKYYRPK